MSFFDSIIVSIVFILFPMGIYLLRVAHNNNLGKPTNKILLDLANLSSIYFMISYNVLLNKSCILLFINIPLLISILKQRKLSTVLASIIIGIYYVKFYNFYPVIPILECSVYFIIFNLFNKKILGYKTVINTFILIKGVTLTIFNLYIIPNDNTIFLNILGVFINLVIFYLLTILILFSLKKGKDVISLNNVLKELEKEKALKNSLFKITHEIKNPIAVCKGYLSMIDYEDKTKALRYNEIIKNEIERTLDIMDNFSAYTKVNVNLEIMDIVSLVEDVNIAVEMLFKEQNIEINTNIPDDEIFINGDYNRLKQVLINLLKNASEAMNKKGTINIDLKSVKEDIILTIKDNGCGMTKEDLKHIKELFYSTKEKGCGIGVPLSFEIIRQHNGEMKYESKKGVGTKVIIKLPKYIY